MRRALPFLLLWALQLAPAAAAELVMVAPTNHAEPLVRFEQGRLTGGILKDLGDALAQRLGATARYLERPSRRVSQTLREGEADLLCYVLPGCLDGTYHWTQPVLDNAAVVAARAEAPDLRRVEDLRGQVLGTVQGYRYPELDQRLGAGLRREDAVDMRANLAKLRAGRMPYAATERLSLRDFQRQHPNAALRETLELQRFSAACALSLHSKWPLAEVDAALGALIHEGVLRRILARYGS